MKKYTIILLATLTFITVIEFAAVMPLGPQIADRYNVSRSSVTYLFIGYTLMGVFTPIIGYFADRYGLKKFLLLSTGLFVIGTAMIAYSETAVQFFIARSIVGLGYYAVTSLIIVYSSEIIPFHRLGIVSGVYKFSFAFSMFIAPVIGSYYVVNFDIPALYKSLSIATFVLFLLLFTIKEIRSEHEISIEDVKLMIKRKEVLYMILATFSLSVPSVFFFNYLSTHLQDIGYSVTDASMIFTIVAIGSLFAAVNISVTSDKIGKLRLSKYGILIATAALFGYFFEIHAIIIIAGVLFGIGYDTIWGLFFPVSTQMYDRGINSFVAILSMSMAFAGVVTNTIAPFVMTHFGFSGNMIISIIFMIICYISYHKGTHPFHTRLQ